MTATLVSPLSPADVHRTLARYMLADGYELVFDFEKSHGSWVHDRRAGRDYLDFLTFFGSSPIGYNHPKMKDPDFLSMVHGRGVLTLGPVQVRTVERDVLEHAPCEESWVWDRRR